APGPSVRGARADPLPAVPAGAGVRGEGQGHCSSGSGRRRATKEHEIMQWTVHGRRAIYENSWVSPDLVDVGLPDGQRCEQHVVRMARPVAGAAVISGSGQVLLIWRHRHVTRTWGWEIPMGRVEEGESPDQAAAREVEEETGWRPGPARLLVAS